MLPKCYLLLFLFSLAACKPFSGHEASNQFSQKNKQLYFMNHELGYWADKQLPQCTLCSYNIHTKKMLPGSILFKQVNDPRGDLVFLFVENVRYSFGVQTGGRSYSIAAEIEADKVKVSVEKQQPVYLTVNQKHKVTLGVESFFIKLQKIDQKKRSVSFSIWGENNTRSSN